MTRDFPGGPVNKASPSNAGVVGSVPGSGAKFHVPHGHITETKKQKQYFNNFNKDFKKSSMSKKILNKKLEYR